MMGLEIGERRRVEQELRRSAGAVSGAGGGPTRRHLHLGDHVGRGRSTDRAPPLHQPADRGDPGLFADRVGPSNIWTERVHPHDRERVLADRRCHREDRGAVRRGVSLAREGWQRRLGLGPGDTTVARRQTGRPHRFQGVMFDITARKEAELKAAEAERALPDALRGRPGGVLHLRSRPSTELTPVAHSSTSARRSQNMLGYRRHVVARRT